MASNDSHAIVACRCRRQRVMEGDRAPFVECSEAHASQVLGFEAARERGSPDKSPRQPEFEIMSLCCRVEGKIRPCSTMDETRFLLVAQCGPSAAWNSGQTCLSESSALYAYSCFVFYLQLLFSVYLIVKSRRW